MHELAAAAPPSFVPAASAARRPSAAPFSAPTVVAGRYRLLGLLGVGGMGHVYRALQLDLRREVALKVLSGNQPARNTELRRRFLQEASVAARLAHPNVVSVYDAGTDGKLCYLAMELLRGEPLHKSLRRARFGVAEALEVGRQVGSALLAAHELGVLHRDVKPANIFVLSPDAHALSATPLIKLLDFGLAKRFVGPFDEVTRAEQRLGSPHYMAPEQVLGQPVDARCDVFGLGGVLFELLTGRPTNTEHDPRAAMKSQVEAVPPAPSAVGFVRGEALKPRAAQAVDELIARALQKDPSDRFASVATFLDAIVAAQTSLHESPVRSSPALHEPTRVAGSGSANQALPFSLMPGPTRWLAAGSAAVRSRAGALESRVSARGPSAPSVPGASASGAPLSSQRMGPVGPSAEAKRRGPMAARTRWPLTALLGAAVGLVGGAAWQHAPTWTVEATPIAGAVYVAGSKVCDSTPCKIRWHKEDIGRVATVRVSQPGYDDVVITRTVQRPNKTLRAQLDLPIAPEPPR